MLRCECSGSHSRWVGVGGLRKRPFHCRKPNMEDVVTVDVYYVIGCKFRQAAFFVYFFKFMS